MKRFFLVLTVVLIGLISNKATAQSDTLPLFSVKNAGGNRVIIGWSNPYTDMKQISIQRSFDSTRNYKTILSVADPKAVKNGFVDNTAPNDHMFYRIFYVVGDGMYFFTPARKAVIDTTRATTGIQFDDNVTNPSQPEIKKPDYVPSYYVYAKNDGNVFINLPDADKKPYRIKFFTESGAPLFEIKDIKENGLVLDEANFFHAGWYHFELFKEDKIVEKHRFYIPKNF